MMVRAARHEIGRSLTDFRAIHHELEMCWLGMPAARLKAVPNRIRKASDMAPLAIVDARLNLACQVMRHFFLQRGAALQRRATRSVPENQIIMWRTPCVIAPPNQPWTSNVKVTTPSVQTIARLFTDEALRQAQSAISAPIRPSAVPIQRWTP